MRQPNARSSHVLTDEITWEQYILKKCPCRQVERRFLKPNAPKSMFLWRLGSNMFRTIGHPGRCEAYFSKLIAPKFFAAAASLATKRLPPTGNVNYTLLRRPRSGESGDSPEQDISRFRLYRHLNISRIQDYRRIFTPFPDFSEFCTPRLQAGINKRTRPWKCSRNAYCATENASKAEYSRWTVS